MVVFGRKASTLTSGNNHCSWSNVSKLVRPIAMFHLPVGARIILCHSKNRNWQISKKILMAFSDDPDDPDWLFLRSKEATESSVLYIRFMVQCKMTKKIFNALRAFWPSVLSSGKSLARSIRHPQHPIWKAYMPCSASQKQMRHKTHWPHFSNQNPKVKINPNEHCG